MTAHDATRAPVGSDARVAGLGGLLARARRPAVTPGRAVLGPSVVDAAGSPAPLAVDGVDQAPIRASLQLAPAPTLATTPPRRNPMPVDAPAPAVEARRRDAVDDESSTPRPPTLVGHPEPAPAPAPAPPFLPRAERAVPPSPVAPQHGTEPLHEPIEHPSTEPSTIGTALGQVETMTQRGGRAPARPVPDHESPRVAGADPSPPMATSMSLEVPEQPTPFSMPPVQHADAAPPVSIGEIHVHVAAPAGPTPDPLALLAPYADGITSRRAGAR